MIPKDSGNFLTEKNAIGQHPSSYRALLNSQFNWDVPGGIAPCTQSFVEGTPRPGLTCDELTSTFQQPKWTPLRLCGVLLFNLLKFAIMMQDIDKKPSPL